jgi:hypothetical protein
MAEELNLDDIFELNGSDVVDLELYCHDCKCPVRVRATRDDQGVIYEPMDGAAGYYPQLNDTERQREYFVKCAKCFRKEPQLTYYNPTEVYTRVVGYYRPVSAFNRGKKAEHRDRKYYTGPDTIAGGDDM